MSEEKLYVGWDDYTKVVEKLCIQIDKSGYSPTVILGIMRGAGLAIDLMSRVFKLKTAYITVSSYHGEKTEDQQGDITFSRHISTIAEKNDFEKCLLVDDLSDTGLTMNKTIEWLKSYDPIKGYIKEIKTACLWKKKKSTFEPDFCAVRLNSNPWISQCFESPWEELTVEELKKKHKKK
jgi:hypothetical protein|tara:strand:- start:283 stop:819 length:537 start_codon:yes stop_codon:yes gene_type:complete